jgi:hypothetical protein
MSNDLMIRLAEELASLKARVAELERQERRPSVILARATSNAGQSIPNNTVTNVDYEDVTTDPRGLITTGASWAFTCPTAGMYLVTAGVLFTGTATWALAEPAALYLYRSGSHVSYLDRCDALGGATQYMRLGGCDVVECAAGDTLQIRVTQISGGALTLLNTTQYNYVSIARL